MRLLSTQPNEDWLTLLTSDGPHRVYLKQFLYGGNDFAGVEKIDDFLYLMKYNDIDYDAAYQYFIDNFASEYTKKFIKAKMPTFGCCCKPGCGCGCDPIVTPKSGRCSSLRQGDFFGRNYDWSFSNEASIVVRTPRQHGRFATVGVCAMETLEAKDLDSQTYNPLYKYLPFFLLDGINEYGLTCSINMINMPKIRNKGYNPERVPEVALCQLMLPRYIIDHFSDAEAAVDFLKKYAIIYAPMTEKLDLECHFLIADRTSSYIVEFIDNNIVVKKVTEEENPNCSMWMTNFLVNKATFNEDGTINNSCLTADEDLKYATGVERMNLIATNIGNAGTQAGMRKLCKDLRYTRVYLSNPDHADWLTEMSGDFTGTFGDLKAIDAFEDPGKFADIMNENDIFYCMDQKSAKPDRTRKRTWQTVHSSVYDMRTGVLYIVAQEGHIEYEFQPCVGAEAYKANEID